MQVNMKQCFELGQSEIDDFLGMNNLKKIKLFLKIFEKCFDKNYQTRKFIKDVLKNQSQLQKLATLIMFYKTHQTDNKFHEHPKG